MLPELRCNYRELNLAHELVGEAFKHFREVKGVCDDEALRLFDLLVSNLAKNRDAALKELARREIAVIGSGLLHTTFSGNGTSAKIVVSRPDRRCEDPYVSESQWCGLLAYLGYIARGVGGYPPEIKTDADFDVIVMNGIGTPVAVCTKSGTRKYDILPNRRMNNHA